MPQSNFKIELDEVVPAPFPGRSLAMISLLVEIGGYLTKTRVLIKDTAGSELRCSAPAFRWDSEWQFPVVWPKEIWERIQVCAMDAWLSYDADAEIGGAS
jgi:hypothetical protein